MKRLIGALVLALLLPSQGWAAVTVDATAVSSAPSSAASKTWNHTIHADSDLILIACGMLGNSRAVSTLTVGGQAATIVDARISQGVGANGGSLEIWKLVNPPTGSQSIIVTPNSSATFACYSTSFLGTAGTVGTSATEVAGDGSISVSSAVGDLVFDAIHTDSNNVCGSISKPSGRAKPNSRGSHSARIRRALSCLAARKPEPPPPQCRGPLEQPVCRWASVSRRLEVGRRLKPSAFD